MLVAHRVATPQIYHSRAQRCDEEKCFTVNWEKHIFLLCVHGDTVMMQVLDWYEGVGQAGSTRSSIYEEKCVHNNHVVQ